RRQGASPRESNSEIQSRSSDQLCHRPVCRTNPNCRAMSVIDASRKEFWSKVAQLITVDPRDAAEKAFVFPRSRVLLCRSQDRKEPQFRSGAALRNGLPRSRLASWSWSSLAARVHKPRGESGTKSVKAFSRMPP